MTCLSIETGTENRHHPRPGREGRSATRLTVLLLLVAGTLIFGGPCSPGKPMDHAAFDAVGPDDGSHLVIFYGSEIMGSLAGCGCMGNPKLGGFPYRIGFSRAVAESLPDVGIIQVDAGFATSLITNASGSISDEAAAAGETTYAALSEAGFAAVNVTSNDIPVARKYYAADAGEASIAGALVSANLLPVSAYYRPPRSFITQRVKRPGGKGYVDVAIIGVTEYPGRLDTSSGFRVTDPREAIDRAVGDARQRADVVIVLAYMPAAAAGALVPSLAAKPDVVIVANSFGAGSADGSVMGAGLEPQLDGPIKVVYSWYKSQKLGVLRLILDDRNRLESATNEYVKLDAPIVPDAAAEAMVARQRDAVRAAKEARYRAEGVQVTNSAP